MKRIALASIVVAAMLIASGCGDTEHAKVRGKAKPVKVLECYTLDPEYPDDKSPCWVEFPDGMQCLRNDNGHGDVYTECSGGRAPARQAQSSTAPADTF